jgi:hypothetical protein
MWLAAMTCYKSGHKLQGYHCYIDYICLCGRVTFSCRSPVPSGFCPVFLEPRTRPWFRFSHLPKPWTWPLWTVQSGQDLVRNGFGPSNLTNISIYSSNAQYHTNSANSLVEFLTRGSRSPTCCPPPLDITDSLAHSPRICLLLYML